MFVGCGGTAPTTLRVVPPLLEFLAIATAMASSLRLGARTVASATRPTVLLQQPSHLRRGIEVGYNPVSRPTAAPLR